MMFAITLFTLALTCYVIAWPFIAGAMQEKNTLRVNKQLRETNDSLRMENQKLLNQLREALHQLKFQGEKRG